MCTCAAHLPRPRRRPRGRLTARGVLRGGVAVLPRVVPPRGRGRETVLRRVARRPRVAHARAPRDLRRPLRETGGGDLGARFLSHWCPPPVATACSLATWTRDSHVLCPLLRLPAAALRHDRPRVVVHGHARARDGRLPVGRGRRDQRARLAVAIAFGGARSSVPASASASSCATSSRSRTTSPRRSRSCRAFPSRCPTTSHSPTPAAPVRDRRGRARPPRGRHRSQHRGQPAEPRVGRAGDRVAGARGSVRDGGA